jgi:DNA-nicking Smr family endonuclease
MKIKDDEAFLKSIIGASPIKKNNKLKKAIPSTAEINKIQENIPIKLNETEIKTTQIKKKENKSFFILEKTLINKKLKKGRVPIDRKIDFHGMSLLNAEDFFLQTILSCYKKKLRCILFVTGKGVQKKTSSEQKGTRLYYGKIRENFLSWVQKTENQRYILAVEQAGIENGADGAFFVYLRKAK